MVNTHNGMKMQHKQHQHHENEEDDDDDDELPDECPADPLGAAFVNHKKHQQQKQNHDYAKQNDTKETNSLRRHLCNSNNADDDYPNPTTCQTCNEIFDIPAFIFFIKDEQDEQELDIGQQKQKEQQHQCITTTIGCKSVSQTSDPTIVMTATTAATTTTTTTTTTTSNKTVSSFGKPVWEKRGRFLIWPAHLGDQFEDHILLFNNGGRPDLQVL